MTDRVPDPDITDMTRDELALTIALVRHERDVLSCILNNLIARHFWLGGSLALAHAARCRCGEVGDAR